MKMIPIFSKEVKQFNQVKASEFMRKDGLMTIQTICPISSLTEVFEAGVSNLPVVNSAGCFVGLIPLSFINVLLKHKTFYAEKIDDAESFVSEVDDESESI